MYIRLTVSVVLLLMSQVICGSNEPPDDLNTCLDGGVCGIVHLNSWGIHHQNLCQCKGDYTCPADYDYDDGKTIRHAFNQYKYCERAPILEPCKLDQIMYTYNLATKQEITLFEDHRIHCLCPPKYLQEYYDTKDVPIKDDVILSSSRYQCKKPQVCKPDDYCMIISDAQRFKMINRRCSCPRGMYCPSNVQLAVRNMTTSKGSAFFMKCI